MFPPASYEERRRRFRAALLVALAAAALALRSVAAESPFVSRYIAMLHEAGVETTHDGLARYLKLHHGSTEQQEHYRALLSQLGDDDFFRREAAMQQLLQMPAQVSGVLEGAANGPDPEVAWRARVVLEQTSRPRNELLYAAFVVIRDNKIPGLAEPILGTVPVCHSDYVRLAMNRALEATVTRDDVDLLRAHLADDDVNTRVAVVSALGGLLGAEARDDFLPLLAPQQPDLVRLTAAEMLVHAAGPEALQTLSLLLDSDQVAIRNRSIQLLQATLKLTLPYSAYAPADRRSRQAEAWRQAVTERLHAAPP